MGIRDIIAHHYFDLDAEIVFNVVKTKLPDMLKTIRQIKQDLNFNRDSSSSAVNIDEVE
jgi:uncharacterized protein with HEPN domain